MRNSKKLIAIIMTVALLASMMVPALAATYQTEADKLTAAGLMSGTAGTPLDSTLTRAQGIAFTIRAMGAEAASVAMTAAEVAAALAPVEDVDTIPGWAMNYAAYAVKNGITNGVGGAAAGMIKFAPNAPLSGVQFVTMMLRSLGYTGITLDNCLEKAVAVNMLPAGKAVTFGVKGQLLRDDAAFIIYSTVNNGYTALAGGVTPSAIKLVTKLVADGALAATLAAAQFTYVAPTPVPAAALTVSAVTAINADQLQVVFNRTMDKTTAETVANYTVKEGTTVVAVNPTAKLQADGKTVLLTMNNGLVAAFNNQRTLAVTVKNVKDAANVTMTDYAGSVAMFDTVAPTFVEAKQVGPKTFDLYFSEPVTQTTLALVEAAIKINGGAYSFVATMPSATDAVGANVIQITTASTLVVGTTYTLTINGVLTTVGSELKDYAGFKVASTTASVVAAKDATTLTATFVKVEGKVVTFKFSKKVSNATDANIRYSLDYNNDTYTGTALADTTAADQQTFNVTFLSDIAAGAHTLYIHPKLITSTDTVIQDLYETKTTTDIQVPFTTVVDATAPTVTAAYNTATSKVEIVFSEAVTGADAAASYTLKNAAGVAQTVTYARVGTTSTYQIIGTLEGTYALVVLADKITDVSPAKNKVATASFTVVVPDGTAPTVTGYTTATDKIYVYFSELMATTGPGSVLDKTNYKISGANLADAATIALGSTGKYVIITTTTTIVTASIAGGVTVGRVADTGSNYTSLFSNTAAYLGADNAIKVVTGGALATEINKTIMVSGAGVNVTAHNQIVFYLDKEVTGAQAGGIHISGNATFPTAAAVSVNWGTGPVSVLAGDNTTTLTLSKVTATFADYTFTPDIARFAAGGYMYFDAAAFTTANGSTTAELTTAVATGKTKFIDKIDPAVYKDHTTAALANVYAYDTMPSGAAIDGEINTIVVRLTEDINSALFNKNMITVANYTVVSAGVVSAASQATAALSFGAAAITDGSFIVAYVTPYNRTVAGTTGEMPSVSIISMQDLATADPATNASANTASNVTTAVAEDKVGPVLVAAKLTEVASVTNGAFGEAGEVLTFTYSEVPVVTALASVDEVAGYKVMLVADVAKLASKLSTLAGGAYKAKVDGNKLVIEVTSAASTTIAGMAVAITGAGATSGITDNATDKVAEATGTAVTLTVE